MLLSCKNSRLHLIQITHGFKYNQICTCLFPCNYLLAVQLIGFLKRKIAIWLKQLSDWSDIQCNLNAVSSFRG